MRLIVTSDKKYGILQKNSIFDVNSFQELPLTEFSDLRSGRFNHLPNEAIDNTMLRLLRRKFPYTKIHSIYVFHINWKQKFYVKLNKDNTMNIYSGYPTFVLKRFLKFVI